MSISIFASGPSLLLPSVLSQSIKILKLLSQYFLIKQRFSWIGVNKENRAVYHSTEQTDLTDRQPSNTSRLDSFPLPRSRRSCLTLDGDDNITNNGRAIEIARSRETWRITPLDLWCSVPKFELYVCVTPHIRYDIL